MTPRMTAGYQYQSITINNLASRILTVGLHPVHSIATSFALNYSTHWAQNDFVKGTFKIDQLWLHPLMICFNLSLAYIKGDSQTVNLV